MRPLRLLPAVILLVAACAPPTPAPGPSPTTVVVTETGPASISTVTERPLREPAPTTPPAESQRFALERARELNSYEIYSATGLEFALINEGVSREDARWAVDNLGEDWNENALEAIHELNQFTMNSRAGMLRDLKQGGFTQEEAQYAVDHAAIDYRENALQTAYWIYDFEDQMLFDDLRALLIEEHGFLPEEADWAVENMYPDAVG